MTTLGTFTGSLVEDAALAWPEALGYAGLYGLDIAPYKVRIGTGARFVAQVGE